MQPFGTFQQENRNFFFDYQMHLKRTCDDPGERKSPRAMPHVVFAIWKKTHPGTKGHEKPVSPTPSHFGWTGNAGFQSLKGSPNYRVRKMFSKKKKEKCFQNQASNICPIKHALIHLGFH